MSTIAPIDVNALLATLVRPSWTPDAAAPSDGTNPLFSTLAAGGRSQIGAAAPAAGDGLLKLIELNYLGGAQDGSGMLEQLTLRALIGPAGALIDLFNGGSSTVTTGPALVDNVDPSMYQVQVGTPDAPAGRAAARRAYAASTAQQNAKLISAIG